jgi:hypothetical protein
LPSTYAPRPYQTHHIDSLVLSIQTHGVAKDGSDPGTGKTLVALFVAKRLGLKPFVVCPKALVSSWETWAARLGVQMITAINYEKLRTGRTKWCVKTGRQFIWYLPQDAILIFDEDHRCKGVRTQTAWLAVYAKQQRKKMLFLSATSATSPLDMWALGYCLGLHGIRNWYEWLGQHGCKKNFFNGFEFNGDPRVLDRLHKQIYGQGRVGSRVRIAEVPDFPEATTIVDAYTVDSPAKINAAYAEIAKALAELEAKKEADVGLPITMTLRARQEIELCKVPTMVSLAEDAVANGSSALVFVNFRETLDQILASFPQAVSVFGGQTQAERDRAVASFQADQARVCVCMIQAGGVGLSFHDLHGNHPRESIISPGWSGTELVQTLGRTRRDGARTKSVNRIVFAAGTVEEQVAAKVRAKLDAIATINDGDLSHFSNHTSTPSVK